MKTAFLALLLVLAAGLTRAEPATAPAEASAQQVPGEFEPFGLRIKVPRKWVRLPEGQSDSVARWGVPKPDGASGFAVLVGVEIAPGEGRTAEMAGNDLAKQLKGTADPKSVLDGEKACRVSAELGDPKNPRPVKALVVRHNGFVYTLSATGTGPGVLQSDALEDLRRGFTFVDPAQPIDHLDLREQPLTILKAFTIRPIVTLRPRPHQKAHQVELRIFNYRQGRPDLVVGMEVLSYRSGATLQQVGEALAAQSGADPASLKWNDLGDSPQRIISHRFTIGQSKAPIQIGLIRLNGTQAALITFAMVTPEQSAQLLYESACTDMVRSAGLLQTQR